MRHIWILLAFAFTLGCGSSSQPNLSVSETPKATERPAGPAPFAELISTIAGPNQEFISGVALSPDGETVAACIQGQPIKLWDAATGKERKTFENTSNFIAHLFSPDGKTLLATERLRAGAFHYLLFINVETGHQTERRWDEVVQNALYTPDGKKLILFGTSHPWLSNAATGEGKEIVDIPKGVNRATLSTDGKKLFWHHWGSPNNDFGIWDMESESKLSKPAFDNYLAASPDGRLMLFGKQVVNPRAGRGVICELPLKDAHPEAVFSPDGNMLVTASFSGVVLWDCKTGKELQSLSDRSEPFAQIQFAQTGKVFIIKFQKSVQVWRVNGVVKE